MRHIALFLTLAGALALGACSRKQPEEDTTENNAVEAPVVEAPVENISPPAPVENSTAAPVAPPPVISDNEQMLDDAAATGMTARLPDYEEPSVPEADEASNGTPSGE